MRTTVNVADDVLDAVRERARREHRSVGEVLSDLARSALTNPPLPGGGPSESFYGFEPFPPSGAVVTNELIDRLREEGGE